MSKFMRSHPYAVLLILSLVLYLAGNNLLSVTDTAEANYAETAREMVLSGHWISPQIYGHFWYDKPIFYYWNWQRPLPSSDSTKQLRASRLLSWARRPFSLLTGSPEKYTEKRFGWLSALDLRCSCRNMDPFQIRHHGYHALPLHERCCRLLLSGICKKTGGTTTSAMWQPLLRH